jgi:DNA-3-methyladenine glycosylase
MLEQFAELLLAPAEIVAPRLLGCLLVSSFNNKIVAGRIVETEAYDQADAASHSYYGKTERTKVMFGSPGYLYVYFTYGMHYCCNIVTGPAGQGAAVLIRALEPVEGLAVMKARRLAKSTIELTNGPAKLCQSLGITMSLNGHALDQEPLKLIFRPPQAAHVIGVTTRIGISKAQQKLWRFYLLDNPYVSKLPVPL